MNRFLVACALLLTTALPLHAFVVQVTDPDGKPLSDARVLIQRVSDRMKHTEGRTKTKGEFETNVIPPADAEPIYVIIYPPKGSGLKSRAHVVDPPYKNPVKIRLFPKP